MKLVHFADVHIGTTALGTPGSDGRNSRLKDFTDRLDEIIDIAVAEDVDLAIFAGDAYKTRSPSQTHQALFAERVARFSELGIPLVMIEGNHEQQRGVGKVGALDIFSTLRLPGVYLVSGNPKTITVKTKSGPLDVACYPYPEKYDIGKYRLGGDIATAHASCVVPVDEGAELDLSFSDFIEIAHFQSYLYTALGHIHTRQACGKNIVYSGSIERSGFGEANELKGCVLCEVGKSWRFVDLHIRPMLDVKVSTMEEAAEKLADSEGAIVRVEKPRELDVNAFVADAFYVSLIASKVAPQRRRKSARFSADASVKDMLSAYFETVGTSRDRQKVLFEHLKEIEDDA